MAFSGVLFATITCLGFSFNKDGTIPFAAPPAPRIRIFLSAMSTFFVFKSVTNPSPSVQSAKILPSFKKSIFAAAACLALKETSSAISKTNSLSGSVTLRPSPPSSKKLLTHSKHSSLSTKYLSKTKSKSN